MRRSGGNSPQRLEGHTFFIERPLGKQVGLALRERGIAVVLHLEVLPPAAKDEAYLILCAQNGWVAFTADRDVSTEPIQRRLIKNAGVRVFRLTRNHWPWGDKLSAFLKAIPAISRILKRRPGPFIARMDRNGKLSNLDLLEHI